MTTSAPVSAQRLLAALLVGTTIADRPGPAKTLLWVDADESARRRLPLPSPGARSDAAADRQRSRERIRLVYQVMARRRLRRLRAMGGRRLS
jgi:hypothetical protein